MDARQIERCNQPFLAERAEQYIENATAHGILPQAIGLQVRKQYKCRPPERPAQLLQTTVPIQPGKVPIAEHDWNDNCAGQL